ncbi:hypothetical protein LTR17_024361 [Elasticomyces elasticus]|nr:hypothetical protein LTR17_024361 [Elasticomyces elasticus]
MSATATTTTTAIPLNVLPPQQPSGSRPAATAALANNTAPVATAHAPAARPVANAAAIPAPPGPGKSIVPKFKASTWLGMALAAAAIAVTVYYGQVMLRLARWSAGNDFRGSCVDDRSIGISSSACNSTLSEPARPPPMLRKRALLVATAYGWSTDHAIKIAMTIAAGAALLVARYTLFHRHLEARPVPVISSAKTTIHDDTRTYPYLVSLTRTQRRNKLHVLHAWDNSSAKDSPTFDDEGDYETSDDDTILGDDADVIPGDDASISMLVRDVHELDRDAKEWRVDGVESLDKHIRDQHSVEHEAAIEDEDFLGSKRKHSIESPPDTVPEIAQYRPSTDFMNSVHNRPPTLPYYSRFRSLFSRKDVSGTRKLGLQPLKRREPLEVYVPPEDYQPMPLSRGDSFPGWTFKEDTWEYSEAVANKAGISMDLPVAPIKGSGLRRRINRWVQSRQAPSV